MKRSIILLALLCKQLAMFSQFTVNGIVRDENNHALTGANITIENTFRGVVTNSEGAFKFQGIKPGELTLKVSFLGYETQTRQVNIAADTNLEFQLERNVMMADEVVVVATRANRNTPVAHTSLNHDDIKQQNQGQDIPYMLSLTPSLVTSSDAGAGIGYTSFRIRGTDLKRINVTVNGIPLNDPESHGVFWVDLPDIASSVENIQIQRGVGTSSVGAAAFGASINLQTFTLNKDPHGEINSAYGSFNTFKNTVTVGSGLINDHFTFDARVSKVTSDGYIDRASSDLKSLHLSAAYRDKKNIVRFNLITGLEETYQAWDGIPADILKTNRTYNYLGAYYDENNNVRYYDNQVDHYQQDHYQLQYSREINNSLSFNTSFHYTMGKGYYEEFKEDANVLEYNLQKFYDNDSISDLVRRKWLDNDFYGFTYSLNYLKDKLSFNLGGGWNNYYGEHYGNVIWARSFSNGNPNHQYYYSDGNKSDFNVFGKVGYQFTRSLNLFADVQYRHIDHEMDGEDDDHRDITQHHTFNFVNPKAGVNFTLNENNSLYGFWGSAQREPNRDDFVDADPGRPLPVSEKMLDYELGYTFASTFVKANVNFYYMDYFDQLVNTGEINDVGAPVMTNVSRSYRQGVEISATVQPLKSLSWNGNLTLSRNKIRNYVDHIDIYELWPEQQLAELGETDISFSPSAVASSQIQYKPVEAILLSFNSKYVGKQFIDNTSNNDHVLNSYFVNDFRLNARFKISKLFNLETIVSVNNLFNEEYETNAWGYQYIKENKLKFDSNFYPQAGRNYMLSFILDF
ncbi:MAG TPA: TonB-dependent receptor [Bacteroidales bacterium]|nr:TonB-dependent receptor [Bacteroidales bacterium]